MMGVRLRLYSLWIQVDIPWGVVGDDMDIKSMMEDVKKKIFGEVDVVKDIGLYEGKQRNRVFVHILFEYGDSGWNVFQEFIQLKLDEGLSGLFGCGPRVIDYRHKVPFPVIGEGFDEIVNGHRVLRFRE